MTQTTLERFDTPHDRWVEGGAPDVSLHVLGQPPQA